MDIESLLTGLMEDLKDSFEGYLLTDELINYIKYNVINYLESLKETNKILDYKVFEIWSKNIDCRIGTKEVFYIPLEIQYFDGTSKKYNIDITP